VEAIAQLEGPVALKSTVKLIQKVMEMEDNRNG